MEGKGTVRCNAQQGKELPVICQTHQHKETDRFSLMIRNQGHYKLVSMAEILTTTNKYGPEICFA